MAQRVYTLVLYCESVDHNLKVLVLDNDYYSSIITFLYALSQNTNLQVIDGPS